MLMAMFTKVNGTTTKLMDMVSISILMEQNLKVCGLKINKRVRELKPGLMELAMKETIN